jgi:ribosomal protein S18 acetylase RimI-like enzyme
VVAVSCEYCGKDAFYRCSHCGKAACVDHIVLRTLCSSCLKKVGFEYRVKRAVSGQERDAIRNLVTRFWREQEQLTFDRVFKVAELPAYVAHTLDDTIGFISFAELNDAVIIVALGVLPMYQSSGRRLVERLEVEAARMRKKRLLVSTSNDDLPALAFYQSLGFQICEVKPNVIAEKHGEVKKGVGGLPVRDELRLQKCLL